MRFFLIFLGLIIFVGYSPSAYSQYFKHTRNEYLREQIQDQEWRVIPKTDWGVFAVDTYLFKDWPTHKYYHGNGYWLNMFAELQPHKDMRVNVKFAPYNGASSYGYSEGNGLHTVVGMSWDPSFISNDWKLSLRYFDLDRETFGVGLLGEEKEIAGFRSSLRKNDFHYKVIIDGTAYYQPGGDTYYQHIDYKNELIGVSYLTFTGALTPKDVNGNLNDRANFKDLGFAKPQIFTLFSKIPWNTWLTSKIEVGSHENKNTGGLASLSTFHEDKDLWSIKSNFQYRAMESGFLSPFAGATGQIGGIYQEYVTPEILDKPFTEVKNIIRHSDRVEAYSVRVEAKYRVNPEWSLESDNEGYNWKFPNYTKSGYFYRLGLGFCPYLDRKNDCLQMYVSNKVLNAGYGPDWAMNYSAPNFTNQHHFGLNAFLYF